MGIAIGIIIGLVLGLTGAGGSIFALPLLVLIPGLDPHEAVGIALGAVAASSLFGTLTRLRSGEIEWMPAMVFAAIGALTTPIGVWLNQLIDARFIMLGFTLIVLVVARKMWRQASQHAEETLVSRAQIPGGISEDDGAYCVVNDKQPFKFGPRCIMGVLAGASLTGILSGLFGVGGGFIIVPTLIFLTGISMKHAVATSLVVITAVSSTAFVNFFAQGTISDIYLLSLVSFGGLIGMIVGVLVGKKISGPFLQKIFSISMVFLTGLMLAKYFQII